MEITRTPISIIGKESFVGRYLKWSLDETYHIDVPIFSARLIEENSARVDTVLSTPDSIAGIIERLKKGERYLYTGKVGVFLTTLVDTIKKQCPASARNFWIFGVNGLQDYGDEFPRLILNHAIKKEQANGEKQPETFVSSGNSYFFLPHPTKEETDFLGKLGFDIKILEDRGEFMKQRLIKNGINVVFNGMGCIYQGILLREGDESTKANIQNTIDFYHSVDPNFLKGLTEDLTTAYNDRLATEYSVECTPLTRDELYQECIYTYTNIPHVIVSSVKQLWGSLDPEGPAAYGAKEQNADIFLLFQGIEDITKEHKLRLPYFQILLNDFSNILTIDRHGRFIKQFGDTSDVVGSHLVIPLTDKLVDYYVVNQRPMLLKGTDNMILVQTIELHVETPMGLVLRYRTIGSDDKFMYIHDHYTDRHQRIPLSQLTYADAQGILNDPSCPLESVVYNHFMKHT